MKKKSRISVIDDLFQRCAGSSLARQFAFADLIKDGNWSMILSEGTIKFEPNLEFPVQLLGSESYINNTQLWAWANKQSNFPPRLLTDVEVIRDYGTKNGLSKLVNASFTIEQEKKFKITGHEISMICSEIVGGNVYYRAPYEGGALFVLVKNTPDWIKEQMIVPRIYTVIKELISKYDLNHRLMVTYFLESQGFKLEEKSDQIIAERENNIFQLNLDKLNRIINLDFKMNTQVVTL